MMGREASRPAQMVSSFPSGALRPHSQLTQGSQALIFQVTSLKPQRTDYPDGP